MDVIMIGSIINNVLIGANAFPDCPNKKKLLEMYFSSSNNSDKEIIAHNFKNLFPDQKRDFFSGRKKKNGEKRQANYNVRVGSRLVHFRGTRKSGSPVSGFSFFF